MTEALLGFAGVFVLALLRLPLAFAMGLVGFVGLGLVRGWGPTAASASQVVYETGFAYTLSVVPLFILMGNFVARAGLAHELFRLAYSFVGHVRGGLAHATVLACAGFGAICGSSIATAATMSKVAYPSMKKLGYADYLSTGVIAAGGTLGIMIPPSTILVIYGIVTETHIGKLFAAGVLPGLMCALLLMAGVAWITWRDPQAGPAGERSSWRQRFEALRGIWGVALLVVLVLGGIYGGVFTATEGAGIGASGAFFFALGRRALTWRMLGEVLIESHSILDYLDSLVPAERALYPAMEPARHQALKIAALATGLADKAVSLFYETRLHREVSDVWVNRCRSQIAGVLAALEADRAERVGDYWFGDRISHADIAVAAALTFLSEVHPSLVSTVDFPALGAQVARLEAMPAFQEIRQPFIAPA